MAQEEHGLDAATWDELVDMVRTLDGKIDELYDRMEEVSNELDKEIGRHKEDDRTLSNLLDEARTNAVEARRDFCIIFKNDEVESGPVDNFQYIDADGFRFFKLIDKRGWSVCYKADDIKNITIG